MSNDPDEIPFMQKLFDRPFVLLAAGIAVMLIFYTLWGIWELYTMPTAPLP